jgi:hypothetical protein
LRSKRDPPHSASSGGRRQSAQGRAFQGIKIALATRYGPHDAIGHYDVEVASWRGPSSTLFLCLLKGARHQLERGRVMELSNERHGRIIARQNRMSMRDAQYFQRVAERQ